MDHIDPHLKEVNTTENPELPSAWNRAQTTSVTAHFEQNTGREHGTYLTSARLAIESKTTSRTKEPNETD